MPKGVLLSIPKSQAGATPRIVTEYEGLPVKVGAGDLTVDAWGSVKVSNAVSVFHGMWTFDIPINMWFMYENDVQVYTSTNIVSENGVAKLLTDATNTELLLESRECPRYQPNRGHLFSCALWCPDKTNDGVRDWGLCLHNEDGVFFRLKSDGLLYAVLERGGVIVKEDLIDTSVLTGFDVEKNNIYDIQYQWRAAGNYKFFIGDPATGAQKLVHTFNLLGTLTTASMENPALPAHFHCERTTENVSMYIGCADITSENGLANNTEVYGSGYSESVSVSTNTPVICVYNPLQINGKSNSRTLTLARLNFTCSKKAVFKVWMTRVPGDITGATFKTSGNSGSYIETDSTDMNATAVRATSVNTSSMRFITSVPVEAASRISVDNPYRNRIEFPFVRGDYLVVTCTAATATADCVIEWGEQI